MRSSFLPGSSHAYVSHKILATDAGTPTLVIPTEKPRSEERPTLEEEIQHPSESANSQLNPIVVICRQVLVRRHLLLEKILPRLPVRGSRRGNASSPQRTAKSPSLRYKIGTPGLSVSQSSLPKIRRDGSWVCLPVDCVMVDLFDLVGEHGDGHKHERDSANRGSWLCTVPGVL